MKQLQLKAAEREKLVKEVSDIFAKGDENITTEDMTTIKSKNAEITALDGEIVRLKDIADIAQTNAARTVELSHVDESLRPDSSAAAGGSAVKLIVPAKFRGANPKNLRLISDTRNEAVEKAYRHGMYYMATLGRSEKCAKWCSDHGLPILKAQSENINEIGGFLVPEELDSDLIQLREMFGVARQLFKTVKMRSDMKRRPRRVGGLKAYHVTDGQGITASTKNWDSVNLTAEKIAVLALYGNELSEDAIIDIGDDLAYEIAWAFALQEDEDAFLGDGTSPYGGFVGVITALTNFATANAGTGLIVGPTGTAASWNGFLLSHFNSVKGLLPRYASLRNPCWVTTEEFYSGVMERLMVAAGGNRVQDVQNGSGDEYRFLGKRVVIAQVMPQAPAASSVPLLYGAFDLGADFGDRRETTIALSTEYAFANDQVAIRGTERYAINVHDVGQATNGSNPAQTAPMPGPIVGLQCASS
jgi:HK97 family phage major capsid protein